MKQINSIELSTYLSNIYKGIGYFYSNEPCDWLDDIRNMEENAEEIKKHININGDDETLKEFNFPIYKGDRCVRPCVYFKHTYLKDGTVETNYYLSNYDYNKYIKE